MRARSSTAPSIMRRRLRLLRPQYLRPFPLGEASFAVEEVSAAVSGTPVSLSKFCVRVSGLFVAENVFL